MSYTILFLLVILLGAYKLQQMIAARRKSSGGNKADGNLREFDNRVDLKK